MARILVNCTHALDNPERASLSFVTGNIAATADQEAVVLLTIEGVWLATKGYADKVHQEGFAPLKETLDSFVANGGMIWACGACTTPRGIKADDLIDGAKIVTAANVVEYLASGVASLSF
jgi:predicted peroxiredoxin